MLARNFIKWQYFTFERNVLKFGHDAPTNTPSNTSLMGTEKKKTTKKIKKWCPYANVYEFLLKRAQRDNRISLD